MKKLKPIPKGNEGLPNLPKSVRNNMGFMARGGKAKNYAYGSMVRSPMNPDTSMNPKMNPMMPRTQQAGSKQGGMGSVMSAPTPMTNKMEGM